MSVGLFTLQNADVKVVGQELDKVIGDKATSPLTGILRIIPIERLNALLVITPQPAYLDEAKKWIARLDAGGGGDGPRLFVYNMQNQRAEKLGPLLTRRSRAARRRRRRRLRRRWHPARPAGRSSAPRVHRAVHAARPAADSGPDDT